MLKSRKHVFWEALLVTVVVFVFGILIGVSFEGSRLDKINDYYAISEISLMDIFALNYVLEIEDVECGDLVEANINFADRIYEEALLLERYTGAGKLGDGLDIAHRKYDLMRTLLWSNSIKVMDKCESDFSTIVYLYEFKTEDLAKKATQNVWSRLLSDLKEEKGNEIILIPIAVDTNIASLDALSGNLNISSYPVVIIDNEHVVSELTTVNDLKKYLD